MRRREFLKGALGAAAGLAAPELLARGARAAGGADDWEQGEVAHLIPAANHQRFLIKVSLREPASAAPVLGVGKLEVEGRASDTLGRFWSFDARELQPQKRYRLELRSAEGRPLCAPWPLATLPHPESRPEHFRLLVYTCAGGDDAFRLPDGTPVFLPESERRRLLVRGLSFQPHAVLAVGDQVYLDQQSGVLRAMRSRNPEVQRALAKAGARLYDRAQPVLGHENERLLQAAVDRQIASLYGGLLRSTPTYLSQDDHDYFEDDRTTDDYVTFPPDPFMLRMARATQRLYYPEYPIDASQPRGLAGMGAADRPDGVSECFGALRYGRLAELLIYDCRRYLTLKGPSAGLVPAETEAWLRQRLAATDVTHVVNVPSTPIGWSAGKWVEWYPDLRDASGSLGTARPKPYWQSGWFAQHNRLLEASSRRAGIPLWLSGDLHSLAAGRIARSGDLDLAKNPVVSVLTGPLGTGVPGWPSGSGNRGIRGTPPGWLEVEESLPCLEKNGFTLLDFRPGGIEIRLFAWREGEPVEEIDSLEPVHAFSLERSA